MPFGDIVRASFLVETRAAIEAVKECLEDVANEQNSVRVARFKSPCDTPLAVSMREALYDISIMLKDCTSQDTYELQIQILHYKDAMHGVYSPCPTLRAVMG